MIDRKQAWFDGYWHYAHDDKRINWPNPFAEFAEWSESNNWRELTDLELREAGYCYAQKLADLHLSWINERDNRN